MKKFLLTPLLIATSLLGLEEDELTWDDLAPSVQEYNSCLQEALAKEDWWAVIDYADIISYNFPMSPFAEEVPFIIGEAYFKMGELELANNYFTAYLNNSVSPRRFEDAIEFKFSIAEQFRNGVKKPLFGSHKMPKILPAKEEALAIYDEVITTLPHSELSAQSLLGKAKIQVEFEDYKPAIETLDLLIRRFPKHDFAAEAYLEKGKVYLLQCEGNNPDPDLLDLARVTFRRFKLAFPREERLGEAQKIIEEMENRFADSLLEIGKFFEKTKKIPASLIYYKKIISKYPDTKAAQHALEKLEYLQPEDHNDFSESSLSE